VRELRRIDGGYRGGHDNRAWDQGAFGQFGF
jgi:hypothetical protein